MILSELRRYLAAHEQVALCDLVSHFDAEETALRGMLEVLERRGEVRRVVAETACGSGCRGCAVGTVELFAHCGGGVRPSAPAGDKCP